MGRLPPKLRRCQIVLNVRPTDETEINEMLHIWDLEDDPGTKSGRNVPTEFEFRRFWRQKKAESSPVQVQATTAVCSSFWMNEINTLTYFSDSNDFSDLNNILIAL